MKNLNLVKGITRSKDIVMEGDTLELECRVDKKIPDNAELAWVKLEGVGQVTYLSTRRKDDGVMDYEEEYSSFIETDGDELIWSLTISRIQENMAGLYQCEVLIDDVLLSSRKVLVSVDVSLSREQDPDSMVYVFARAGSNVTLNCSDLGEDMVTWRKDEVGEFGQRNKTLPLIRVDKTHSGVYTCTVSEGRKQMKMSLLISHLPIVSTPNKNVLETDGASVQLKCEVSAVPVPVVSWNFYNQTQNKYQMILSHGRRFITIQDYKDGKMISSLDIKNLTQNDFGKYSCIARNCILYSLVLCISKM